MKIDHHDQWITCKQSFVQHNGRKFKEPMLNDITRCRNGCWIMDLSILPKAVEKEQEIYSIFVMAPYNYKTDIGTYGLYFMYTGT